MDNDDGAVRPASAQAFSMPEEMPEHLVMRHVAAATIGNALEFYDFITYAFFAIQIGHAFFPVTTAYGSLMLSLATFGAGFITRPIGGVIIGAYSDRVGRRPAMMLSFTLMGAAIIVMALIPSYSQIGIAAPILAVIARMVQGFSLGGEVGPTTAYLLESAPPHRRGLAVSWQAASQAIASTTASVVGFTLAAVLSAHMLDAYGWRIAFLLGAVTLPFGLWIRRSLPETLHQPETHVVAIASSTRVATILRENSRIITLGLMVLASGTISTYVLNYHRHLRAGHAENGSRRRFRGQHDAGRGRPRGRVVRRLVVGSHRPAAGDDRIEAHRAGNAASGLPLDRRFAHRAGSHRRSVALEHRRRRRFRSALRGPERESPKQVRGGTFATMYAVSIALFGGTTQLVITWLIHLTGNPLEPAYYLFGASLASGPLPRLLILESAPVRIVPKAVLAQ